MITFFEALRVFGPMTMTFLLLGAVKLICDIVLPPTFSVRGNTIVLLLLGMLLFVLGLLADLIVRTSRTDPRMFDRTEPGRE